MPIFSTALDKGLTVSFVLNSRIGSTFLAIPIDPIAFEVAKMGIDRLASRLGPLSPTWLVLQPVGIQLDDSRLDSDAT
jgi:hypothetical protein